MSLDTNCDLVAIAVEAAHKYYDKETYKHAFRVARYTIQNHAIPDKYFKDCYCLGLMHDLLEDTDYDANELLPELPNFKAALDLLTKPRDMKYETYCARFKDYLDTPYGLCAWFVKLADMKDHLSQVDTLTPKLKEKYLNGLRYLL